MRPLPGELSPEIWASRRSGFELIKFSWWSGEVSSFAALAIGYPAVISVGISTHLTCLVPDTLSTAIIWFRTSSLRERVRLLSTVNCGPSAGTSTSSCICRDMYLTTLIGNKASGRRETCLPADGGGGGVVPLGWKVGSELDGKRAQRRGSLSELSLREQQLSMRRLGCTIRSHQPKAGCSNSV